VICINMLAHVTARRDRDRSIPRRASRTARISAGFGPRQCAGAGGAAGFARHSQTAPGAGRFDRGMQALDWSIHFPQRVERAVVIAWLRSPPWGWHSTTCNARRFSMIRSGWTAIICPSARPPGAGPGPPDRHGQLQIDRALRRALWPPTQPQRRRPVGAGESAQRARRCARRHFDRRPIRHCRLS